MNGKRPYEDLKAQTAFYQNLETRIFLALYFVKARPGDRTAINTGIAHRK